MFIVFLFFSLDFGFFFFYYDYFVVLEELYLDVVEGRYRYSFIGRKKNNL